MQEKIGVLIKTNSENEIINIKSSVFVENTAEWIEIDSGFGDKYVHAQNNYLPKKITDLYGRYNFKYTAGEIIEIVHGDYIFEEDIAIQM
ncbi:MAG: hypothetical protein R3Y09_08180 [Clostridia bacterium]